METKPTVYLPHPRHGHKGDSFRELAVMWRERELVDLQISPDRYCWWGFPGDVLLHDLPLVYDVEPQLPEYKLGLFGNEMIEEEGRNNQRWIFWSRNPKIINNFLTDGKGHIREPKFRYIESMFVGKIENALQANNRFQSKIDWSKYIEDFKVVKGVNTPYPYTPQNYTVLMAKSKFALCLPGYGPKCNRDIEAITLGCIPIMTPGCCTEYYNPLVENENYLRIRDESEIESVLRTDDITLSKIYHNNRKWYDENVSVQGSFATTKEIIERHL